MSPKNLREKKIAKNILTTTVKQNDFSDFLLYKYELHKVLRISAWVISLINNSQKVKKRGPLTTSKYNIKRSFMLNVNKGRSNKVKSLKRVENG